MDFELGAGHILEDNRDGARAGCDTQPGEKVGGAEIGFGHLSDPVVVVVRYDRADGVISLVALQVSDPDHLRAEGSAVLGRGGVDKQAVTKPSEPDSQICEQWRVHHGVGVSGHGDQFHKSPR